MKLLTPAQRLKYAAALSELNHKDLAKALSIPLGTLRKWESGERTLNNAAIKKCVKSYKSIGLNFSEEWLQHGHGITPKKIQHDSFDQKLHTVAINLQNCANTIDSLLSILHNKRTQSTRTCVRRTDFSKIKDFKLFTNYNKAKAIIKLVLEIEKICCMPEQLEKLTNTLFGYIEQKPNLPDATYITFTHGMIKFGIKCNAIASGEEL